MKENAGMYHGGEPPFTSAKTTSRWPSLISSPRVGRGSSKLQRRDVLGQICRGECLLDSRRRDIVFDDQDEHLVGMLPEEGRDQVELAVERFGAKLT